MITKRKIRNGGAADDAIAIAALDGWPIEHTASPADGRTGMAHIIWVGLSEKTCSMSQELILDDSKAQFERELPTSNLSILIENPDHLPCVFE